MTDQTPERVAEIARIAKGLSKRQREAVLRGETYCVSTWRALRRRGLVSTPALPGAEFGPINALGLAVARALDTSKGE